MTVNRSRERFVELAEKRVTKAIKDLRLVGNLSNRSNYSYTEEDVRKIMRALKKEIRVLDQRFQNRGDKENVVFKLN